MAINEVKRIVPFIATHPLDVVKDEMEARGISKKEFAARLGIAASNLSRMFREKQDVSVRMAEKLEEALDISASFWLDLQAQYDKDVKAIARRDKMEGVANNPNFKRIEIGAFRNQSGLN